MSQGSLILPTTGTLSGLTLVQLVNAALANLAGLCSGATDPSTLTGGVQPYSLWMDTTGSPATLKMRNAANDDWLTVGTITSGKFVPLYSAEAAQLITTNWSANQNGSGDFSITGYGTELVTVNASGDINAVGNVTSASDESLKENWRDYEGDFVAELAEVKHGIYDRIDTAITQIGVGAKSLQLVMPHAVDRGDNGLLRVSYGNAALYACVKIAKEIVALRAEIKNLKGE